MVMPLQNRSVLEAGMKIEADSASSYDGKNLTEAVESWVSGEKLALADFDVNFPQWRRPA